MFFKQIAIDILIILIYVDDILVTRIMILRFLTLLITFMLHLLFEILATCIISWALRCFSMEIHSILANRNIFEIFFSIWIWSLASQLLALVILANSSPRMVVSHSKMLL